MANKHVSTSWINEQKGLLNKKLPKEVQKSVFLPDDYFYLQYYQHAAKDPVKGLHYMATVLFDWLRIKPNGCMVDFYNEKTFQNKSADAAGWYTKIEKDGKQQEIILINEKYSQSPFDVAAILAHEMMHLFLFRNEIELDDIQENELLTDLATIQAGLPVLILNGMSKETQWLMTIIGLCLGMLYWHSEQKVFGYFQPKQYGEHARIHFGERKIPLPYVIGHIQPSARYFIPGGRFTKAQNKTKLIQMFEKRRMKANLIQGAIAVVLVGLVIAFINYEDQKDAGQSNLSSEIDTCKTELTRTEQSISGKQERLKEMENTMSSYEKSGNIRKYNEMVDPYNQLLTEVKMDMAAYDKRIDDCNAKVGLYNSNL